MTPEQVIIDLQAQVQQQQNYMAQMNTAFQGLAAQIAMGAGKGNGSKGGYGVDTKVLGRPDIMDAESKWHDWSVVMRAYAGVTNNDLGVAMETVEGTMENDDREVRNAALGEQTRQSSIQLY